MHAAYQPGLDPGRFVIPPDAPGEKLRINPALQVLQPEACLVNLIAGSCILSPKSFEGKAINFF
jgi:hypothetical protein